MLIAILLSAAAAAGRAGTVRNLVCWAIVEPLEADYGDQEGHTGRTHWTNFSFPGFDEKIVSMYARGMTVKA
jgi:hypothetical protein